MSEEGANLRTRADYVAFLESQLDAEKDDTIAALLRGLFDEAKRYERSTSVLGTISRLVEACNAIESGEASKLANKAGVEQQRLRAGVNKITSVSVEAYVNVRRTLDKRPDSEWTGPHAVTIRKSKGLSNYVKARADRRAQSRRPRATSRDRRLQEIVDKLPSEDRNDMRFALEDGRRAAREAQLIRNAVKNLMPDVDLDDLLTGKPRPAGAPEIDGLADEDVRVLKRLVLRLTSPDDLKPFGLITDGVRVKMPGGMGSRLIERAEMEILRRLARMPATATG